MGLRGPKPKPLELKLLEGNRGHRPISADGAFRPVVGIPTPPAWLSKEAKKAWKRLSVELVAYNVLSAVDRDAFVMLCQTIGRMEQIEQSIAARQAQLIGEGKDPADALIAHTPNGMRVQAVIYQLLNREQSKLTAMLAEFGLSPSARTRVTLAVREQLQLFQGGAAANQPDPQGFDDF